MSAEFSLRALSLEIWSELGSGNPADLAAELIRRVPDAHRLTALEETLAVYASYFARGRKIGDITKESLRGRLERRTKIVGECFIWTGKKHTTGYGSITISDHGRRNTRPVHRVSYQEFVGPIPDGYQVDHECHSRNPDACPEPCIHVLCWNPAHLRAVTPTVNMQHRRTRSLGTRCRAGHEYTPENVYTPPSKPWVRVCIPCRRARDRAKYSEQRAVIAAA